MAVTHVLRRRLVRDYLLMTVGVLLTAFALDAFLVPNKLAAGGVSGLATIVYYFGLERGVTLPVGVQMLIMNAILLTWAFRARGMKYAARTIYGSIALSVGVDVMAPYMPNLAPHDLLLAALYGGALAGLGLALVFKGGGNTGGTDIIAQLISPRTQLGVGQVMLAVDAIVVTLAAVAFGPELALYAVVAIAISGWTIDLVLEGLSVEKACFIVSDQADRIGEAITGELKRGATAIEATGVYSGQKRGMLFVVLSRRELDDLKQVVGAIDPRALLIISDVHEAIGEGFKEMGVS